MTTVIEAVIARGIVIGNVSESQTGFVKLLYAPNGALGKVGMVFGHELTTEAALTKLSYLVALPRLTYDDIVSRCKGAWGGAGGRFIAFIILRRVAHFGVYHHILKISDEFTGRNSRKWPCSPTYWELKDYVVMKSASFPTVGFKGQKY